MGFIKNNQNFLIYLKKNLNLYHIYQMEQKINRKIIPIHNHLFYHLNKYYRPPS